LASFVFWLALLSLVEVRGAVTVPALPLWTGAAEGALDAGALGADGAEGAVCANAPAVASDPTKARRAAAAIRETATWGRGLWVTTEFTSNAFLSCRTLFELVICSP
jgi:hypothetical protein